MKTAVNANPDEEVLLMDMDGKLGKFTPLAIIHHSGNIRGQTTQGHYRADVKNKETKNWFRTSDNEPPESLSVNGLTKMGYIFLYKKSNAVTMDRDVPSNIPYDVPMDGCSLFEELLKLLDEMDLDLVFHEFAELTCCEAQWIASLKNCHLGELSRCVNMLGKR